MKTYGEAAADPGSEYARKLARCSDVMQENARTIARYMAEGATAEQAWARLLQNARPVSVA